MGSMVGNQALSSLWCQMRSTCTAPPWRAPGGYAAAARADEEYGRGVEETLEDDVCERSGVQWTRQDVTCITFLRQTGEHLVEVHDAQRTRLWVRLGVDAIMRDWSLLPTVSAAPELRNSNYYSSVPHTLLFMFT